MSPDSIRRAIRLIRTHLSVVGVGEPCQRPGSPITDVEIEIQVEMPLAWKARGTSPNGVKAKESALLRFSDDYPLYAPLIFLRPDFDRSLAHFLPGPPDARPQPCIYDGDPSELIQQLGQHGLTELINHLVAWLEKAALDRLIDPDQGWEPVRRDRLTDVVIADLDHLRSWVKKQQGCRLLFSGFLRLREPGRENVYGCLFGKKFAPRNPSAISALRDQTIDDALDQGTSLAIVVWPDEKRIAGSYMPETVTNLGELKVRADSYGCSRGLFKVLDWLSTTIVRSGLYGAFPIGIILLVRRPYKLIGSESSLEACPYIIEIDARKGLGQDDQASVRPAGHRHSISRQLLQRMSGFGDYTRTPWVQVGAGSLGSKIALHLARAGDAPSSVIDDDTLSPHNAARHAVLPLPEDPYLSWGGPKAFAVAKGIAGLGQATEHYTRSITSVTRDAGQIRDLIPENSWALVNSTASLAVREALSSISVEWRFPRVIETSLLSDGMLGIVTIEGPGRRPDTGGLISYAYDLMRRDHELSLLMFRDTTRRPNIGEGCSSHTMIMSDARISLFAASVSELIHSLRRRGLSENYGQVFLGQLHRDGISLQWRSHNVDPFIIVAAENSTSWKVHVSRRADDEINAELERWQNVETGGILLGRLSESARAIYVIDALGAPSDSTRSASHFLLGVLGVRAALEEYARSANHSLYCVGTWHSHLAPSAPSGTDHATGKTIAVARLLPSTLLVVTPQGYRALLAEGAACED